MTAFDPARERALLAGDSGFRWALKEDFSHARALGGLASNASADLAMAIQCLLVGYAEPAALLLEKARQWLQAAIELDEKPRYHAPSGTEALRYADLAVCNWLLTGRHDGESLGQFVAHEDRYLANYRPARSKRNICLTLPTYVDAGAYERVLALFSAVPGLSPPSSLASVRDEGRMCYVISRYHIAQEHSDAEVQAALERFLTRNTDGWLGNGHFIRAAEWMKIAYWKSGTCRLSPNEVVMKCYAHLPGRERPGAH